MADTTDGPGPAPPRVLSDRFITAHLSAVVGTWPLAFSASHHARRIYSTVWCAIVTAQPMIYRNGSLVALSLLFFSFLFSPLVVVVAVATRTAASAISRSVLTNSLPLQRRTSLKMRENIHFFFQSSSPAAADALRPDVFRCTHSLDDYLTRCSFLIS